MARGTGPTQGTNLHTYVCMRACVCMCVCEGGREGGGGAHVELCMSVLHQHCTYGYDARSLSAFSEVEPV